MTDSEADMIVNLIGDLWETEVNPTQAQVYREKLKRLKGNAEQAAVALTACFDEGLSYKSITGREKIMVRLWASQRQPDQKVIEAKRSDTGVKLSDQQPGEHVADWLLRWPDAVAAEGDPYPIDCTPEQWRAMDDTSRASTWAHAEGVRHACGAGRERFVRLVVRVFEQVGVSPEDIAGWLEQHFHGGSAQTKPAGDVDIWEAVA